MPRLGNTFSILELRAVRMMYGCVMRGDVALAQKIASTPEVVNVVRKFGLMESKHDEMKREAEAT